MGRKHDGLMGRWNGDDCYRVLREIWPVKVRVPHTHVSRSSDERQSATAPSGPVGMPQLTKIAGSLEHAFDLFFRYVRCLGKRSNRGSNSGRGERRRLLQVQA